MKTTETHDVVENGEGYQIAYNSIRRAMEGMPFRMELVGAEARAVEKVVNLGIDGHLEACVVPDRGDRYEWRGRKLHCVVSLESFPTLIRRLFEIDHAPGEPQRLADDMLHALGFDEDGVYVGRPV